MRSVLDDCGRMASCFSYVLLHHRLVMLIQVFQEADSKMGLDVQDISLEKCL